MKINIIINIYFTELYLVQLAPLYLAWIEFIGAPRRCKRWWWRRRVGIGRVETIIIISKEIRKIVRFTFPVSIWDFWCPFEISGVHFTFPVYCHISPIFFHISGRNLRFRVFFSHFRCPFHISCVHFTFRVSVSYFGYPFHISCIIKFLRNFL